MLPSIHFENIKKFAREFDYTIFLSTLLISLAGLAAIYTATRSGSELVQATFTKQIVWLSVSLVVMFTVIALPPRLIYSISLYFYVVSLLLLVIVLFVGTRIQGAARWISFGFIAFQPSELAKLATIFMLANFLSNPTIDASKFWNIVVAFIIVLIPTALVIRQPDLGTSLVFAALILPVLYRAGLSLFAIFFMFSPVMTVVFYMLSGYNFYVLGFMMAVVLIILYLSKKNAYIILTVFLINLAVGISARPIWSNLHDYQKKRIIAFINPESDPKGAGYQVLQAQTAVGSGGLTGKGFLEGSQTQLQFLPEQHTDFIFAVIGEEGGFLAGFLLILLFLVILFRAVRLSFYIKDLFLSLVIVGIASALGFQVMVNIGMNMGIMPVTGLPLPLVSYGGSSLLVNFVMIGILISLSMRKNTL